MVSKAFQTFCWNGVTKLRSRGNSNLFNVPLKYSENCLTKSLNLGGCFSIFAFVNKDKYFLIKYSFLRLLMINNKPFEDATKPVKPIGSVKMV